MNVLPSLLTDQLDIWTSAETEKKSGRGRSGGNGVNVYGIKKLRELIYELAAMGRIVDHEENAKAYPLGEISNFIMGQAPPGNECNTHGEGIVFVKTGEFGSLFPEIKEWTTKPLKFAKKGDVLICVVGATIGKLNLAIDCAIGRSVAAIRPNEGIDTKYLYFALIPFTLRLREKSRGSAQGVIGKVELASVMIRVPSINEQKQIVAKIDELMALCDQLETQHINAAEAHEKLVSHLLGTLIQSQNADDFSANWQRIAAHFDTLFTTEASIDALKQTLLQLAVMGKLVPQDPNDEPASELLKRIQAEKAKLVAEGKIKRDKPLPPITSEEKPFELPQGWRWVSLGDYATDIATGPFGSMIHQSDYVQGGMPLINPSHMIDDKIIADKTISISKEMAKTLGSYAIYEGDIVMARRGEAGRIALVTENENGWLCGTGSFVLRFCAEVYRDYLRIFFRCDYARVYLTGKAVGTTMVNLNHGILRKMSMGLPPLPEQHRIVAKVDKLMALCDQLKSRITQASQLQQKLADVIVEQAIV